MSPALTASASLPATTISGSQPLPVIPQWTNPIPEGWRELDEKRKFYFQAEHNMFLEMHPNGTRGVNATTKFCVLTILILNITGVRLNNDSSQQLNNWNKNSGAGKRSNWRGQSSSSRHVIVGNHTGLFLCMDDRSVVYQTRNFNSNHCVFDHEYDQEKYKERYYRHVNGTRSTKWYLGLNKDGSIRCGNVTRKKQSGANFTKVVVGHTDLKISPPFAELKKECCTNKSCKTRRKNNKEKDKGKSKTRKKRCYKNWCKKHRRRFFTLKLKELRRYYNRCVKKKIRHSCRSGKKDADR